MNSLLLLPILSTIFTPSAQRIEDEVKAGQKMTLNECMIYAINHNSGIKKQELTNDNYRQDHMNATAWLFPSASGSVSVQNNYGRGVDPETNTYINTETFYNTYDISTQMPIFAGLSNINTYRASKLMLKAGEEELKVITDNVALNTMQAFMSVVYYTASVDIAKKQLETSTQTLTQSKKMLELGLKSAADVAQIETQVASNDLTLTQQQNELNLAILNLKEQMNYPIDEVIYIDTCLNQNPKTASNNIVETLNYALVNNPKIRQSDYSLAAAQLSYKAAFGQLFPSVYIYAGYRTQFFNQTASVSSFPSFTDQLRDNRGTYIGAQLNIPIFSGLDRKTALNKQRNSCKIAEHTKNETKRALQTEITQTILQMEGYRKEYIQATRKVEAAEISHKAAIQKFAKGLISPIELQNSANDLIQAQSQQLNARLQLFIKGKMLNYYNGEPLTTFN